MAKKIKTFADFFKALRASVDRKGYDFIFLSSRNPRRLNGKLVCASCLYHKTPSGSYLSPIQVVYEAWFAPKKGSHFSENETPAKIMGIPKEIYEEILLAGLDYDCSLPEVRRALLKAVGKKEPKKVPYL